MWLVFRNEVGQLVPAAMGRRVPRGDAVAYASASPIPGLSRLGGMAGDPGLRQHPPGLLAGDGAA